MENKQDKFNIILLCIIGIVALSLIIYALVVEKKNENKSQAILNAESFCERVALEKFYDQTLCKETSVYTRTLEVEKNENYKSTILIDVYYLYNNEMKDRQYLCIISFSGNVSDFDVLFIKEVI